MYPRRQRKTQGCGCLIVGVLLLSVLVVWAIYVTHHQAPDIVPAAVPSAVPTDMPLPPPATPSPTVAYQLAVIQAGVPLPSDDPLVGSFDSALKHLETKCKESERHLSDFAVVIRDDMQKRGVEETLLSILSHVDASIPPSALKAGRLSCAEIFAAYATLRLDGFDWRPPVLN